jgi:hypothetical protein
LERLARSNNVTIRTDCTVTRITRHGVYYQPTSSPLTATTTTTYNVTAPLFLPADVIIVNADLPYATRCLLDENETDVDSTVTNKFDWDDQYRFSCGVFAFHWCVDRPWTGLTTTHSVFLSASTHQQAVQSWATVRGDHDLDFGHFLPTSDEPFNFYVHRPSHSDPSAAPEVGGSEKHICAPCKSVTDSYRTPLFLSLVALAVIGYGLDYCAGSVPNSATRRSLRYTVAGSSHGAVPDSILGPDAHWTGTIGSPLSIVHSCSIDGPGDSARNSRNACHLC